MRLQSSYAQWRRFTPQAVCGAQSGDTKTSATRPRNSIRRACRMSWDRYGYALPFWTIKGMDQGEKSKGPGSNAGPGGSFLMSVSIVPAVNNHTVYQVFDDLGRYGRVWTELGDEEANKPAIIRWMIEGQFKRPLRVIAFNTEEGKNCSTSTMQARHWVQRRENLLSV